MAAEQPSDRTMSWRRWIITGSVREGISTTILDKSLEMGEYFGGKKEINRDSHDVERRRAERAAQFPVASNSWTSCTRRPKDFGKYESLLPYPLEKAMKVKRR